MYLQFIYDERIRNHRLNQKTDFKSCFNFEFSDWSMNYLLYIISII